MNLKNQTLQNSLRCLQHPATLLSITLLLINDHVLKIDSPSWLTGKLSDFAGLFFFPFIVAVFLSLLLSKKKITSRQLGQIAFGFVGIWFALRKTSYLINSFTSGVASIFVKGNAQIILDPTDLIALIIMFPAWKLWNQPRQVKTSKRLAYASLAVGAFAVIATSPIEWTVTSVTDLVYSDDGILYAADRETFGKDSYPIAKSVDGGLNWEFDNEKVNLQELGEKSYPIKHCLSRKNEFGYKICYRITHNYQFEVSYDYEEYWYEVFSNDISIKARDFLIITFEKKSHLLIAVGEGGILRKQLPDGNWEIIDVMNAGNR